MKPKSILKKIASMLLLGSHRRVGWQDDRLHVLIERVAGITDQEWRQALDQDFPAWQQHCDVKFFDNFAVRDRYLPETEVLIGTWFSAKLMMHSPRLKLFQLAGVGTEFLEGVNTGGRVAIATAAGLSAHGVAEHVLLLMLALDRRLDLAVRQQQIRQWKQGPILNSIRGLHGRIAGIVGLGNVGAAVASLLSAVRMSVIYFDVRRDIRCEAADRRTALNDLLAESDYVIICVPLDRTTRGMIAAKELAVMKKSAYLVNVARGGVIDENSLVEALHRGGIAGAALDTLESEPLPRSSPLWHCPNLIISPHVAGNIYTHRGSIMKRSVQNIEALVRGRPLTGVVQPTVEP